MSREGFTKGETELLVGCVDEHLSTGLSTTVGTRAKADKWEDAAALVRAGHAEWWPPIPPISHAVAKRAGRSLFIRDTIESRDRIVPTSRGVRHVQEHQKRSEAAKKGARARQSDQEDKSR